MKLDLCASLRSCLRVSCSGHWRYSFNPFIFLQVKIASNKCTCLVHWRCRPQNTGSETRGSLIYIFPAVRGTVVRVMHIEDGSQEVGRKTRRVATSPTTETNLAQFLPFYTQLASCGCPSQWVAPDKKRNGPAGKLQFFLGELQEDDRKRHVVTSLPSWYIIFDFYSFLPVTALWFNNVHVSEVYKLFYNINWHYIFVAVRICTARKYFFTIASSWISN